MAAVLRIPSRIHCYSKTNQGLLIVIRHASTEKTKPVYPVVSSESANLPRGTGGRSSFSGKVVTVFGGAGFLGRAVVNKLGKSGSQVVVPYRSGHPSVRKLKLCGDLGQIMFVPFNLKDEESIYKAIKPSNFVINLIGKNHETSNFSFEEVHVNGPRRIARISKELGIEQLLHVSALNASENPKPVFLKKGSQFLASKWRGEQAVREEFPKAIIFRPSDLFGPWDNFMTYYGSYIRHTFKALSLWNRGVGIYKQPVFQSDVAEGIMNAVFNPQMAGKTFQAIGPHRYELCELLDWFHRVMMCTPSTGYYRFDLRYDVFLWIKAFVMEKVNFIKYKTLTYERIEREHVTDVIEKHLPTLEDLGVELTHLEDRIFTELKHYRAHRYYDPLQKLYVRPVDPAPHVPLLK